MTAMSALVGGRKATMEHIRGFDEIPDGELDALIAVEKAILITPVHNRSDLLLKIDAINDMFDAGDYTPAECFEFLVDDVKRVLEH